MISVPAMTFLPTDEWQDRATAHRTRAERYTVPARRRRDCGVLHPIEDFLFQYYPYPISLLENWQPGCGVALEWKKTMECPTMRVFSERHYSLADEWIAVDPSRLTTKEADRLKWITDLLVSTRDRQPNFACHGLHEWAMVYRGKEVRHEKSTPLRLPQAEIDALVESRSLCCTHHDAFRFFASEARPMNRLQPTLESRIELEQPGCVHANMDLYKWAAKSMPWIGSELLLDCFVLAIELRDLDMRASPYDLTAWGREPICIETQEGRRIYEIEQRRLASEAVMLRDRLIAALKMLEFRRGDR